MKNSRPRIKFSQTPHSISRRIETIPNKTASSLLSLINRKTVGFGVGYVDLPYRQISAELGVGARAIQNAAKLLEQCGDIIRERVACRIYRWRVVLERDEIIEDPSRTYTTKPPSKEEVRIERSGPCGSSDPDHADRAIRTPETTIERTKDRELEIRDSSFEQKIHLLKNSFKERDLKKQQQTVLPERVSNTPQRNTQCLVCKPDDEPLHKYCLKSLLQYGVSQRVARKLCRENDHELIKDVLDTVPKLSGIENLGGYLVAAIRDGGYKQDRITNPPVDAPISQAHLNSIRTTKSLIPSNSAPISYRNVQQTKAEQQALEDQRLEREKIYQEKSRQLTARFEALSDDLKLRIKLLASVHLSMLLPASGKREEMLRDKTFRKMANRTVLERFFGLLDDGMNEVQALQLMECRPAA